MCFTQKIVFTICAHFTVKLVECKKFHKNPDKTGRYACIVPLCQHSQALAAVLGFCQACKAAYAGLDISNQNTMKILWNFWCFKAAQKWDYAVDPSRVPVTALTSPAKMLCKSWFGYVRTYKEVSMDMIMAMSVRSLANALGEPVTTRFCDLCRMNHCKDIDQIAIGMREATISWARRLEPPEEIFKSYEVHHGSSHLSAEKEAKPAACGDQCHETMASSHLSRQQGTPQPPPTSPLSNEEFLTRVPTRKAARLTKRLNAKVRMEIVIQEREEMFKTLEAEHNRRVRELQAQVDLDDAGGSADTSSASLHDATIGPLNPPKFAHQNFAICHDDPKTPSPRESLQPPLSGGVFGGFSGAWEYGPFGHVKVNNGFELCESPCRDATLHHHDPSYADLVGGSDEFLFERRRARRSQYGEIMEPEEISLEEQTFEEYLSDNMFSFRPSPPSRFVGGVRRVGLKDELAGGDDPEYPRNEYQRVEYPEKRSSKDEYARNNGYGKGQDSHFHEDLCYDEDDGEEDGNEQEQSNEEDTIDGHIDFYLDDDSISTSERVRPLTYVSPQSSRRSSSPSSPQTPSPPGPRNRDALPGIPPVSPLHITEFSFWADLAERSSPFHDHIDRQRDASHSERFMNGVDPALERSTGEDTFGPASRVSSEMVPLLGPEIRAVAPPRPARNPMFCITHGVKRQNGCQRCQAGGLSEVGLKPGERVNSPEPEQF
ncbi:hypothetical protein CT0861_01089 [Colletotrichum tofieldiae]|uniref:Uncharacterized protein n=1 Tax=Colletotrichum tofieldiae TaxID=708197 RepID=A0A161YH46_9PEZI|nr:hypothetical protein CT0861_01089 [Colletotrichum tofieldiae]